MLSFAASFVILFIVTIDNFFSHIFDIVSFFSGNDNNGDEDGNDAHDDVDDDNYNDDSGDEDVDDDSDQDFYIYFRNVDIAIAYIKHMS